MNLAKCRIIGVFNNEKSVELVLKGLEALKNREEVDFRICTENADFCSKGVHELKQKVNQGSRNCIACSSCCKTTISRRRLGNEFVADAELYNVDEVKGKYHIEGENSYEMLSRLIDRFFLESVLNEDCSFLNEIDGAYAFAYWIRGAANGNDLLYIARDILGLKSVCFAHTTDGFAFASEKKALEAMGYPHAIELDPRVLLSYNIKKDRLKFVNRDFFPVVPELTEEKDKISEELLTLLRASISRMIPREERFGVLFSGGLDSTLIAYLCKDLDADFVCYTVAVDDPVMKEAEDLVYAKRIAADLGLALRIKKLSVEDVETYLKGVVPLIDDTNGVKISVAVPIYAACEMAKEDGINTVLYGLGTEELFAGYERHRRVKREDLNRACLSGLLGMYERDLYKDNMVATWHGISLRAPFLATDFVAYALRIPAAYKLTDDENKVIVREIARELGLKEEVASRKKRAVQYGSNVVKAIEKLAKREGYRYTRDYLRTFYPTRDIKLGCLFSSGKDSAYALWLMQKAGYPVECLITIRSRNQDSFVFHTPAIELVELQAEAIGLPLVTVTQETEGEKDKELEDLRTAFREAKATYGIEGVITDVSRSRYKKEGIERIAREENLKVFAPLWHINQETELRLMVSDFEVIFTGIRAYGLDRSGLGRRITMEDVDRLVELDGEIAFESLALDGPVFKKRLVITGSEIVEEEANTSRLVVKKAKLMEKHV
ncbi:MAG: diphthine--ammonia ligase [Euryarchaeota archaeon]|nr:diphthine--ammonia ligase [Euryarchaeota archaeon]